MWVRALTVAKPCNVTEGREKCLFSGLYLTWAYRVRKELNPPRPVNLLCNGLSNACGVFQFRYGSPPGSRTMSVSAGGKVRGKDHLHCKLSGSWSIGPGTGSGSNLWWWDNRVYDGCFKYGFGSAMVVKLSFFMLLSSLLLVAFLKLSPLVPAPG